jgi:hypothetical protein
MDQCLRCKNPRAEASLFCTSCQTALLNRSLEKEQTLEVGPTLVNNLRTQGGKRVYSRRQEQFIPKLHVEPDRALEQKEPVKQTSGLHHTPPHHRQSKKTQRLRIGFLVLVILAVLAFLVDVMLGVLLLTRPSRIALKNQEHQPMGIVSPQKVMRGSEVRFQIKGFAPHAQVMILHDTYEPVLLKQSSSLVKVDANGQAIVVLPKVDWVPGSHRLFALDRKTSYEAGTTLQVVSTVQARPARLEVDQELLDMGAETSTRLLLLKNRGDGISEWSASSAQDWLRVVPDHGVFSENQSVRVAVSRARLQHGTYMGTVTIRTSAGQVQNVQVRMEVLGNDMLEITPHALTLSTPTELATTVSQRLQLSNRSAHALNWSFYSNSPPVSAQPHMALLSEDRITIEPPVGRIAAGQTVAIQVRVHAQGLLPGSYSSMLALDVDTKMPGESLYLAIALSVQPSCALVASSGSVTLAATSQRLPVMQTLALKAIPGCAQNSTWRASSNASWLSITPESGQVGASTQTSVKLQLRPGLPLHTGVYNNVLLFISGRKTHTVITQLTASTPFASPTSRMTAVAQPSSTAPSPTIQNGGTPSSQNERPKLTVSPPGLVFQGVQGKNIDTQGISLRNSGGGILHWQASVETQSGSWINLSNSGGLLAAGEAAALEVRADGQGLPPGTYTARILISGKDDMGALIEGGQQEVSVRLTILAPCSLQAAPTHLEFQKNLLEKEYDAQNITLQVSGSCPFPVSWRAMVDANSQRWITLSSTSGDETGSGSVITVFVKSSVPFSDDHEGHIAISASDNSGVALLNSPQTIQFIVSQHVV